MDPLSVTASCVGILSGIAALSEHLSTFVRHTRDARKDVDQVRRDINSLSMLVEHLETDSKDPDIQYPAYLKKSLVDVLHECEDTVAKMSILIQKVSAGSAGRQAQWALTGKSEMEKLRIRLEGYKSTISLALEMITMSVLTEVKNDTVVIKEDTTVVKQGNEKIQQQTMQIILEINDLKEKLFRAEARQLPEEGRAFVLQRFLDQSSSYAETVISESQDCMSSEDDRQEDQMAMDTMTRLPVKEFAKEQYFKSTSIEDYAEEPHAIVPFGTAPTLIYSSTESGDPVQSSHPPKLDGEISGVSDERSSGIAEVSNDLETTELDLKFQQIFEEKWSASISLSKFQALLNNGAKIIDMSGHMRIDSRIPVHYHTALERAILIWRDERVVEFLLSAGADVNAQCRCNVPRACRTALRAAVRVDSPNIVARLLEHGADANARRNNEATALQIAVMKLSTTNVSQLLKYGADADAFSDVPLHDFICAEEGISPRANTMVTALTMAAFHDPTGVRHSKVKAITEILLIKGAKVNLRGGSLPNALGAAANRGCSDCVGGFLKYGACCDFENPTFKETLIFAAKNPRPGAESCISILLEQATGKLEKDLYDEVKFYIDTRCVHLVTKARMAAALTLKYRQDNREKSKPKKSIFSRFS